MNRDAIALLIISLAICCVGLVSIYSSSGLDNRALLSRQLLWIGLGLICFLVMYFLSYRQLWDFVWFFYIIAILFLLLVMVLGSVRMGAQRWIKIGWLNFQPSELVKLTTVLVLARYYAQAFNSRSFIKDIVLPFMIIGMPVLLIMEQPDLGSAIMVLLITIAMIFLANVNLKYILFIIFIGLLSSPLLWHFLKDYQKQRLLVFINPNMDPLGAGYTIIQSKIAIGSGILFGKGWLSGSQGQLHFLPESHTDFIFATWAEEHGFLGTLFLLVLYYLMIRKIFNISLSTNDKFGRLLGLGICAMFTIQLFVNISMTLGLCPVVGLPLPLVSYGGSSLIMSFIALGVIANISKTRLIF